MNTNDLIQRLGLSLINLWARAGDYEVEAGLKFGNKSRNRLDYYFSRGEKNNPTIIFFYGGNWRSGEKGDYRFVADALTRLGFNVVIPDYRLYPLVRFDQILDDVRLATHWVIDQLPENQPLFLMGHSAGAQLAALLSLNVSLLGSKVRRIHGVVGLAGPYDFYPFTEDDHWDLFSPEENYPDSQPVNFVRDDCPPLYLLHGEIDTRVRRGHSKSLMEKTWAAGGKANREVYPGLGHVDIIVEFSRLKHNKSPVLADIQRFLSDPESVGYGPETEHQNQEREGSYP